MKKIFLSLAASALILGFVACNNDKTEVKTATPEATKPPPAPEKVEPKTEISVSPDGGEVKTKDVKVKIDTKDTLRK